MYPDKDAPYYTPGMAGCAGAMVGVVVLAVILRFYLSRKNRSNEMRKEVEYIEVGKEEEDTLVGGKARRSTSRKFEYML